MTNDLTPANGWWPDPHATPPGSRLRRHSQGKWTGGVAPLPEGYRLDGMTPPDKGDPKNLSEPGEVVGSPTYAFTPQVAQKIAGEAGREGETSNPEPESPEPAAEEPQPEPPKTTGPAPTKKSAAAEQSGDVPLFDNWTSVEDVSPGGFGDSSAKVDKSDPPAAAVEAVPPPEKPRDVGYATVEEASREEAVEGSWGSLRSPSEVDDDTEEAESGLSVTDVSYDDSVISGSHAGASLRPSGLGDGGVSPKVTWGIAALLGVGLLALPFLGEDPIKRYPPQCAPIEDVLNSVIDDPAYRLDNEDKLAISKAAVSADARMKAALEDMVRGEYRPILEECPLR